MRDEAARNPEQARYDCYSTFTYPERLVSHKMADPTSPIFDFCAVPKFRTAPMRHLLPAHLDTGSASHGAHATPEMPHSSVFLRGQSTAYMPQPPSPKSPAFHRSVMAGDARVGDAEGAQDDAAFAAELLRPRPIPPRGVAGSTSDPVEASADSEAYERDGVTLCGASRRSPPRPATLRSAVDANIATNIKDDIYARVSSLLQQYSVPVAPSFPVRHPGMTAAPVPARVAPFTPSAAPVPQYPTSTSTGTSTTNFQAPDRVLMMREETTRPKRLSEAAPPLVERVHASHTSPRPDLASLLAHTDAARTSRTDLANTLQTEPTSSLQNGTDTSHYFDAGELLSAPPSTSAGPVIHRRGRQQPPTRADTANKQARNPKYQHVTSKYLMPTNRSSSVDRPRTKPSNSENRSASLPRTATAPAISARETHVHMAVPDDSSVANPDKPGACALESKIDSLMRKISKLSRSKVKVTTRDAGNPSNTFSTPNDAHSQSMDHLRSQLHRKQAELKSVVEQLQTTESTIQTVNAQRAHVEDLMKLLVSKLKVSQQQQAAASNSSPTARPQPMRPHTPPIPPPLFPFLSVAGRPSSTPHAMEPTFQDRLAPSPATGVINISDARDYGMSVVNANVASAAASMFFPLPQPTDILPSVRQEADIADMVSLRLRMAESSLSKALQVASAPTTEPSTGHVNAKMDDGAIQKIDLPSSAATVLPSAAMHTENLSRIEPKAEPHIPAAIPQQDAKISVDDIPADIKRHAEQERTSAPAAVLPSAAMHPENLQRTEPTAEPHIPAAIPQQDARMSVDDIPADIKRHAEQARASSAPAPVLPVLDLAPTLSAVRASETTAADIASASAAMQLRDVLEEAIGITNDDDQAEVLNPRRLSAIYEAPEGESRATSARSSITETTRAEVSPPRAADAGSKLCVQCESELAARRCHECGEDYCDNCFALIHKAGKRKQHLWTPFSPQATAKNHSVNESFYLRPSTRLSPADTVRKPGDGHERKGGSPGELSTMKGSLALFRRHNEAAKETVSTKPAADPTRPSVVASKDGFFLLVNERDASDVMPTVKSPPRSPSNVRVLNESFTNAFGAMKVLDPASAALLRKQRQDAAAARFVARMHSAHGTAGSQKLTPFSHQVTSR